MVRLSKLADYSIVLMAGMARGNERAPLRTARDLAAETKLPLPTVTRLLKVLHQGRLLVSHRGNLGGYTLAKEPQEISLAEIVDAVEGPIALTECSTGVSGACEIEVCCSIKKNQRLINRVVRGALQNITLSDLIHPLEVRTIMDSRGNRVPVIRNVVGRIQ
jgi:FeS assembly SUF system regulator